MSPRDEATLAQVEAARPDASTWLAANAGSGKTRVLTDRVARLLLNDVAPQHILCLTYTKAAASEMQNRLFERLGEWAMLEDTPLRDALVELGSTAEIDPDKLREARTLFARAIETPGGLKIQTIHSFCASLLRRFPLEACVSPQFTEIEDRAAELLRNEIVDDMAEGGNAALITDLARYYTGEDFAKLTQAIVKHRQGFTYELLRSDALELFEQSPDLTVEQIESSVFLGSEKQLIEQMVPPMLAKGGNDERAAVKLQGIETFDFRALGILENVFLTGKSASAPFTAKTGTFPTEPTRLSLAGIMPAVDDFMRRVEQARDARLALGAAEKTLSLHNFAARFLPLYEQAKTVRGWLDFDDLIDRARLLLSDERVAEWVLFRIDGGIDHILVDEAQDTSPAQWDVIRKLAAEFSSGRGARENDTRTIFVVGDKKQSIYSFQGADPREFDRMQAEFQSKFEAAEKKFQNRTLAFSFRSASAVLEIVDRTFEGKTDAGFNSDVKHKAFKSKLPGRVDLWPLVEQQETEDDREWHDPLDRKGAHHHDVILANQIAEKIKWMISSKQVIPIDDTTSGQHLCRPVSEGDFLILVQRRTTLFSEIIRACKIQGLAIAGADRLKVGGELAVRDLAALLSFLAVPEDDLSLASALKSPLFGWSEQDLFNLAHGRSQDHLWPALRDCSADYPATMAILNDLRRNTDFLRPFDLIERILTRHKGRARLLARLGTEAEDGIDALLSQALAYERNAVPSLTGFLVWMETDDLEIKRQVDSASDQIRVMTVHGAKGLEAPIVILPECGKRDVRINDDILTINNKPVWKTVSDDMPGVMATALEDMKKAQIEERLRLLYVALTRAEKWLIIAAAGALSKEKSSWYELVEDSLEKCGSTLVDFDGLAVKRYSTGDWTTLMYSEPEQSSPPQAELEIYFRDLAPTVSAPRVTVSPSDLGGAKALSGDSGRDEEAALAYGTLVHQFLEHLSAVPAPQWPDIAKTLASENTPDIEAALLESKAVLTSENLRHLFGDNSLKEVALTADLGAARLHGVVDRLVIEDNRVLAVDFKTNSIVPQDSTSCPEGLLRQMGAYVHALQQIYPDRQIDTAILWTNTCSLMPLPHEIVIQALQKTPYLDDSHTGT